jgi:hypothetical protein
MTANRRQTPNPLANLLRHAVHQAKPSKARDWLRALLCRGESAEAEKHQRPRRRRRGQYDRADRSGGAA